MTTAQRPSTIARRGDLAALVSEHVDAYIGAESVRRTVVELGVVTSVSREGVAKAVRDVWGSVRAIARGERVLLVYRDRVDAEAVRLAAAERVYVGTRQPRPFDSVDEAVAFVRPFATAAA